MKAKQHRNGVLGKRVVVDGERMVMVKETDFDRLLLKADEFEPKMPDAFADGNYPAVEALRVQLAITIIRHRRRLGWTQVDLARRAGIRLATLLRLEEGRVDTSIRTVDKIDKALRKAERKLAKAT